MVGGRQASGLFPRPRPMDHPRNTGAFRGNGDSLAAPGVSCVARAVSTVNRASHAHAACFAR